MSFKNLQQRFEENVDKLYRGSQLKFDGGKASTGANDDPLLVQRPGDGYWTATEGRSTPVISAARDVKRLTLFTASRRGILFLAKQQLLQTGNTFQSTRFLNPSFVIGNAIPFLHIRRSVKGTLSDTSYDSLKKIGQLQEETYSKLTGSTLTYTGVLAKIPVIGTLLSAASSGRSVGDTSSYEFKYSRPELKKDSYYVFNMHVGNKTSKITVSSTIGKITSILDKLGIGLNLKLPSSGTTLFSGPTPNYGAINSDGTYTTYLAETDGEKEEFNVSRNKIDYRNRALAAYRNNMTSSQIRTNLLSGAASSLNIEAEYSDSIINRFITKIPTYFSKDTRIIAKDYDSVILNPSLNRFEIDSDFRSDTINSSAFKKLKENYTEKISEFDTKPVLEQRISSPIAEYQTITDDFFKEFTTNITQQPFIKYFVGGAGSVISRERANARDIAVGARTTGVKKISYVRDPLNAAPPTEGNLLDFYKADLPTVEGRERRDNDAITVSFAMGKDDHVQFRAFISGLQQSASPQYKTYQYIGRIEKFVSYSTVERQVSFKLGILAFSKDELDIVWKRINYMTGLVYPYGYNKGILQPNIVRMTIGNVYRDQPCYITSMNTSFTDLTETWDIDKEVPISAMLSITANLIEKDAKTANKPFYGIVEPSTAT
jgi:hypothetical protein